MRVGPEGGAREAGGAADEMVFKVERTPRSWRYVLRPNRSATWTEIKLFFALIAGVSVVIAVAFTLLGFWPVLPFAGAELGLLWLCLWHNASGGRETEVIDIDDNSVAVERGRRSPAARWRFDRAWTRIRIEPAPARLHPSRLLLGSHGRDVRLGRFLPEDELERLARDLRADLARS